MTSNSHTESRNLLALIQKIAQVLEETNDIDTILSGVLGHFCEYSGWPVAHAYIWSPIANALISSQIWHAPEELNVTGLRDLTVETQFKSGKGIIGKVLMSGQPITIADLSQEPEFLRQAAATENTIQAYFAFPIKVDGTVLAVLEFFSPDPSSASTEMFAIIDQLNLLLGLSMQRRLMLTQLQKSEAQLAEAQRIAQLGNWEWDIANNLVTWSAELYQIFGLDPASFTPGYEGYLAYVHSEDRAKVERNVLDCLHLGISFNYNHRIIRPDGVERIINARGQASQNDSNETLFLRGTVQDITRRQERDKSLAKTMQQLSYNPFNYDISEFITRLLTLLQELTGADTIILLLVNGHEFDVVSLAGDENAEVKQVKHPLHSAIASLVWQNGQPLLLSGDECENKFSPQLKELIGYQAQAIAAAPIHWQDNALGVLEVVAKQASLFDEDTIDLLESVAIWTAIILNNAHQYKNLRRRLKESDAVAGINSALAKTMELDSVLKLIVKHILQIIPDADWTDIHLLDSKSNQIVLVASSGLALTTDSYIMNKGEGIAGHVIETGRFINVPDVQNNPRHPPFDLSTNARSLLVAPIKVESATIGAISVQCAQPAQFTIEDERLLTNLAVQASIGIDNARLYDVQKKLRKVAEKRRKRMQELARRVVIAQEEERAKISRELHDESGQSLTSLKISLGMIQLQLPAAMQDVKDSIGDLIQLTDKTLNSLRLLSHNLRPPGLDAYGLHAALEGLCQDFVLHTPLKVIYQGVELPDLLPLTELALYRFAQECLTNVVKHARAREAHVSMALNEDMITLIVKDDGCGFNAPNISDSLPADGVGLSGILERLEMVGGQLLIESTLGEGSQFKAEVQYKKR